MGALAWQMQHNTARCQAGQSRLCWGKLLWAARRAAWLIWRGRQGRAAAGLTSGRYSPAGGVRPLLPWPSVPSPSSGCSRHRQHAYAVQAGGALSSSRRALHEVPLVGPERTWPVGTYAACSTARGMALLLPCHGLAELQQDACFASLPCLMPAALQGLQRCSQQGTGASQHPAAQPVMWWNGPSGPAAMERAG